jgi:acyl dehydratase
VPIDVQQAVGARRDPVTIGWDERDVLLYHLSLGAGIPPTDPGELRYAFERDLQVLPTFAVVAGNGWRPRGARGGFSGLPGVDIDPRSILHGEQSVEVHAPIPAAGEARSSMELTDVWDKGKAAVLRTRTDVEDLEGRGLWTARASIFVRGEGGFGGQRGPSVHRPAPDRDPDTVLRSPTSPQQALLYRLNGDRNPLHADPEFAAAAGFDTPILHGLCTYGVVCKAVVDGHLGGDATALGAFEARFGGIVLPGETLVTSIWEEAGELIVQATTEERGEPVLTNAVVRRAARARRGSE